MKFSRRKFFTTIGKGAACLAVLSSLPSVVWAKWNGSAFAATDLTAAIDAKYPGLTIEDSDKVSLKAPAIAENGAVVPVSVKSSLDNIRSISLFVVKNPSPLISTFNLSEHSVADVSIRIRMGTTSEVIALVEADGKLYRATSTVKVTIGGCGG